MRNLLAGRRVLAPDSARSPPPVLVLPRLVRPSGRAARRSPADSACRSIMLWRGYGRPRWPAGDTVRWQGADGDSVVLFHLPRDGYEFGSHLPIDDAAAAERWQRMRAELAPRSATGVMLIPNGADHHARQASTGATRSTRSSAPAQPTRVHRSSLRAFAERLLVERAAAASLPVVRGELRDSYGYTWTLQGTFATRAHEKRMNAHAERLLLREAEPWAALAARAGKSRRPLVEAAWRRSAHARIRTTRCAAVRSTTSHVAMERTPSCRRRSRRAAFATMRSRISSDTTPLPRAKRATDGRRSLSCEMLRRAAVGRRDDRRRGVRGATSPSGPGSAPRDAAPVAPPSRQAKNRRVGHGADAVRRKCETRARSRRATIQTTISFPCGVWPRGSLDAPPYGIATPSARRAGRARGAAGQRRRHGDLAAQRALARRSSTKSAAVAIEHAASGRAIRIALSFIDERDVGDLYTPAPRARDYVRRISRRAAPCTADRCVASWSYAIECAARCVACADVDVDSSLRLMLDAGAAVASRRAATARTARRITALALAVPGVTSRDPTVWADAAFGPGAS